MEVLVSEGQESATWDKIPRLSLTKSLVMLHQISSGYITFCIDKDVSIYSFH